MIHQHLDTFHAIHIAMQFAKIAKKCCYCHELIVLFLYFFNVCTGSAICISLKFSPGVVFMSGGITYDGHISKPGITELNSYSAT